MAFPVHVFNTVWCRAVNGVTSVVLAPSCAACDAVLATPLDGCVCRNCWDGLVPISNLVFEPGTPLSALVSIGAYDGTLREIVHALKYQGRRSIAAQLALRIRRSAADLLAASDCVVPIPLHWRRKHTRGFNQAHEIARHLGLPVVEPLIRFRATRPQVELSAEERRANVAGAFAIRYRRRFRPPAAIAGLRFVLVDDVATTGATLEQCAAILCRAGAASVAAVTAARKA
jgi:ComF family protein